MRAEFKVLGIIQGVGFRPFVYRIASTRQLVGFIRNRGDAGVEIVVEGEKANIQRFIHDLKDKKPPQAQIYSLTVNYGEEKGGFCEFKIVKSSRGREASGSIIPPDVSICSQCLQELRNPEDRRFGYFFITCTDCGPRYTIINELPYDRPNTTMHDFTLCKRCKEDYRSPTNRRFHAQTVACPKCGPRVFLATNRGELIKVKDPIREAGKLLEEGSIIAVKGNGGFHLATATTLSKPIKRLRKAKHRVQKPFAVMARSLKAARSFAVASLEEARLLTSPLRPILLLRKSSKYYLSNLISPGLHNIGVMLPYTGLHVMLFDNVKAPAFVMTSANPPSEPIITENREAVNRLISEVDYFLLHERTIAQRCDDSVIRVNNGVPTLIRRSRGYAPTPIHLKHPAKRCTLSLGAEENIATCILQRDKAFISQYIGDVDRVETLNYLLEATEHLLRLTNVHVEVVACDLHPGFSTTHLAHKLGEEWGCPVVQVQHHHAHIAALMGEHNISSMMGICCDGLGYGADGRAWGGEILHCHRNGYHRLGHLQEQPMVGGDRATLYPIRMAAGILHGIVDIEEWFMSKAEHLPYGEREARVILNQLNLGNVPYTTSCGRVLDAVSAVLNICHKRTYEGEPAMKLESQACRGRDILHLKPRMHNGIINTTFMLQEIFDRRKDHSAADLAYSAQAYLARSLAQLASEEAKKLKVHDVGLTGGVAYNELFASEAKHVVEQAGLLFHRHVQIPPGDGGISFGQAVFASEFK